MEQNKIVLWIIGIGSTLVCVVFIGGYFLTRTTEENLPVMNEVATSSLVKSLPEKEPATLPPREASARNIGGNTVIAPAAEVANLVASTPAASTKSATSVVATTSQVVIGYVYEASGGPQFQTLTIAASEQADWQQKVYEIDTWNNGTFVFYKHIKPMEQVTFPKNTVYKFKILGIDPKWEICVEDHKFPVVMSFTQSGSAKLLKTAVTQDASPQSTACMPPTITAPNLTTKDWLTSFLGDHNPTQLKMGEKFGTWTYSGYFSASSYVIYFTGTSSVAGKIYKNETTGAACFIVDESEKGKVPEKKFCLKNTLEDVKNMLKREIPVSSMGGISVSIGISDYQVTVLGESNKVIPPQTTLTSIVPL